jgi:hypothetical protein
MQTNTSDALRNEIRTVFGAVPFPAHRGLRAAMAMDSQLLDSAALARITAERDVHSEWWDTPSQELRDCVLAIAYLDAAGVEFYLPAYMTLALEDVGQRKLWVLHFLDPCIGAGDDELRDYFRGRLARIDGERSRTCVKFLEFLRRRLDPADPLLRPESQSVDRILKHEYWRERRDDDR